MPEIQRFLHIATSKRLSAIIAVLIAPLLVLGCRNLKSKAEFRKGTQAYKEERFRHAIDHFHKSIAEDPDFTEAHVYLAASHHNLYRLSDQRAENLAHLEKTIAHYLTALSKHDVETEAGQKLRLRVLPALVTILTSEPHSDCNEAYRYVEEYRQCNPSELEIRPLLIQVADCLERKDGDNQARDLYDHIRREIYQPKNFKDCKELPSCFGRCKNHDVMLDEWLKACPKLRPDDPTVHLTIASFMWDRAYRDPFLAQEEKESHIEQGLAAIDRALKLKPDYFEALVYKYLLLRMKARSTDDPTQRARLERQADEIRAQAYEIKDRLQRAQSTESSAIDSS